LKKTIQKLKKLNVKATAFIHLGDNCIVFENFMASIGDMMVAN
jgi:hypothetical protein